MSDEKANVEKYLRRQDKRGEELAERMDKTLRQPNSSHIPMDTKPHIAPKPSKRAMVVAKAVGINVAAFLSHEGGPTGNKAFIAAIAPAIDKHVPAYDELLAACKASADSPHHPTCPLYIHKHPRHRPGLYVASCDCHVDQALAALALAEPEQDATLAKFERPDVQEAIAKGLAHDVKGADDEQ